jgi:hypothetical protein
MAALLIGYARCSTDHQDLTAQREGLISLGVAANRIHVDHGLTGTNRERPGLREALAACRDNGGVGYSNRPNTPGRIDIGMCRRRTPRSSWASRPAPQARSARRGAEAARQHTVAL